MRTGRVEAFSDGVLAILITIMVLELPKPHGADWSALGRDLPVLLAYVLSFAYIGIYWSNHHHLFQAVRQVRGGVLWANLHLLFWLSLVPFATAWISEQWVEARGRLESVPVVSYGVLLLGAGVAYWVLQSALVRAEGPGSPLARAVGQDVKGKASVALYVVGVVLAVVNPWLGLALYAGVAVLWFVPDRRVERTLAAQAAERADAER